MTERVIGPTGSPRRRRTLLLPLIAVIALGLIFTAGASADLSRTLFELDKDATNDATYTKIAVLNAAVSADTTAPLETTIQICQDVSAFYNGAKILIDAERMTLANGANAAGGGCPSGFDFKRSYLATRGVDGTSAGPSPAGDHSKAENISKIDTGTTGVYEGDDWNQVYDLANGDPDETCSSLGAVECVFSHDGRSTTIFTSSKDYDEISGTPAHWQWRDQSVPDANELDDGFAIKYIDGSGDQQLYFGADRFATEGTKDAGFWFFQKKISPVPPVGSADGVFTGTHTAPAPGTNGKFCVQGSGDGNVPGGQTSPVPACTYDADDKGGDVLVLTSFSNGGATVTIRVFEWVGPGGSTASLLQRGVQGDCVPGALGQDLCATVNNTTVESEWSYDGKGELVDDEISAGGLLEGGINLTDLNLEGCFSSFMATTRSSDTLTADPKDWILGDFEACDSDLTTTPKTGAGGSLTADSDGDNLDEITIGTNGQVQVTDSAVLNVQGTSSFTGTLAFYICGPFANPNACSTSGVSVAAAAGVNPVTANGTYSSVAVPLTSVGRYCWYAFFDSGTEGVPDADDGTIESAGSTGECFEVMPVTPTLATCSGTYAGTPLVCTPSATVDFGNPVSDRALLSGLVKEAGSNGASNGGNATYPTIKATNGAYAGEIEFTLKGPAATGCGVTALGTGTNPQTLTVDTVVGNKVYGPVSFTPNLPGRYSWQAQWRYVSGSVPTNPNNSSPVTHNASCDDPNEDVTVRQIPSRISTRQRVYPNDSARIESTDAAVNLPGGGEVTFRLYVAAGGNSALVNCQAHGTTQGSGGLVYVETKTLAGGAAFEVVATDNSVYPLTSLTAQAYWWVTYDPKSTSFTGRQSNCIENTSVTFTDDAGPGTLFTPSP